MKKDGVREKLMKQVVSMTEEKVKEMLAWIRSRRTGHTRRKEQPLQELKRNLASMTDQEVKDMVEGTRRKPSGCLSSLIFLPAFVPGMITKITTGH